MSRNKDKDKDEKDMELAQAVPANAPPGATVSTVGGRGRNDPPKVRCFVDAPSPVTPGTIVILRAKTFTEGAYNYHWDTGGKGTLLPMPDDPTNSLAVPEVRWDTTGLAPGSYLATVTVSDEHRGGLKDSSSDSIQIVPESYAKGDTVPVDVTNTVPVAVTSSVTLPVSATLTRALTQPSDDQVLWTIIRNRTRAISFNNYRQFIDSVMCGEELSPPVEIPFRDKVPFHFVDAYNRLKVATEFFLMQECGTVVNSDYFNPSDESSRMGRTITYADIDLIRNQYLDELEGENTTIPYFSFIRQKLSDLPLKEYWELGSSCYGILRSKLFEPCLLELIWNYWEEEAGLEQVLTAISLRFQNRPIGPGRNPLADLDLDPIRPLNNLMWGYIQDEQHRLNIARRVYEYDHHYGLTLYGKAVPRLHSADSRSKFLEAFHNLLYRASLFYKADDDTTKIADGFEVLNALREVHLLLAHGMHNQYGDLPSTARAEMLIGMWLISRPEMREAIGGKVMIPYAEPWMDRVDAIKTRMGWGDVSVSYFHDLATYGEQLLLSARYGHWTATNSPVQAANWARYWRAEVQRYIHAYRTVTGVDLSLELVDTRLSAERYLQPSVHLRNRQLLQQRNR